MLDKKIINRLKSQQWYVKCINISQFELLMQACKEANIHWCYETDTEDLKMEQRLPIYIGTALTFCNKNEIWFSQVKFNKIPDITKLLFK